MGEACEDCAVPEGRGVTVADECGIPKATKMKMSKGKAKR